MSDPFWKTKTLAEMSQEEWESLCDGCGRCCLISLEDADTAEIYLTNVSCKLFNAATCRCSDYAQRTKRVRDCVKLTPANIGDLTWMPKSCAYRLIHDGEDLYWWHPLVSGDPETVHESGVSVRDKVRAVPGLSPKKLMERIVEWPLPPEKKPGTDE